MATDALKFTLDRLDTPVGVSARTRLLEHGYWATATRTGYSDTQIGHGPGELMAIRIKARGGESAEQMLRRFKKLCEKEGLTKDMKRRAYYEKPSEKKQRALRKSIKRIQMAQLPLSQQRPQQPLRRKSGKFWRKRVM